MTRDELIQIGFEEIPHFTVMNDIIYHLGRNRHLSIGCVATPNEVMYICETHRADPKQITDLVCLHNFDYDGYLTLEKVKTLIACIGKKGKMVSCFCKGDTVISNGVTGEVWKVSEQAVHVRFQNDFFQKFFFLPKHHKQSSINELKHKPHEKTL